MKVIKKLINTILNILIFIFGAILLITAYNALQVKVLGNDYSAFFGYSIFEVQTGSMEPEISAGDWVVIKKETNYLVDDIITFKKGDSFITHRIIETYKDTYVTKGDVNNAKDDATPKEMIVGRVVKVLPSFGALRASILNPGALIAIIVTLYVISFLFKDRKRKEPKKEIKTGGEEMIKLFSKNKKEVSTKKDTVLEKESAIKNDTPIIEAPEEQELTKEIILNEEPVEDEDLDKTIYFRMISVDETELDKDISKAKEKTKKSKIEKPKAKKLQENKKEEEKTLITKTKKFKNIYAKVIYLKENELNDIIDILESSRKLEVNESSIKSSFLKTYIDGKYYNYCGNVNVEYNHKNMIVRLTKALEDKSIELANSYKGKDKLYSSKVDHYTNIFILLLHLETMYPVKEPINDKRLNYEKKITKYLKEKTNEIPSLKTVINEIITIQKRYASEIKDALENLSTNDFALEFKQINKNIKYTYLKHNIAFSKVYSKYIVDKAYSEGIVAEDKIAVLLTLLSKEIVLDMLEGAFSSKYLISLPSELYAKTNKLSGIFAKCEDEYAKNTIVFALTYEQLSKNNKAINELYKEGFRFAVSLSDTNQIKVKDNKIVSLMDYIFIPRTREKKELIASLNASSKEKVIYEDITKLNENNGG